ncbi:CBS domain-containing protein [Pseudidiomarina sp.]|uniref:CBS domain-containing protein n=1 Tax=Pseudidiomarina sp. TaxID=2081707 RepID=UPI003A988437
MKVKTYMSPDVRTIKSKETLQDAAKLMLEADCGALPVLNEKRQLVGMLTDRDIALAGFRKGQPLKEISVADAMSKKAFSINADDQLTVAEELMQKEQIRRLPVLDSSQHLIGILSLSDIAVAFHRDSGRQVKADEVANTLASICRHRSHAHTPAIL